MNYSTAAHAHHRNGTVMEGPTVRSSDAVTLAEEAATLRREIVQALYACGGGHYGGSLSVLDILLTLYRTTLRIDPDRPDHPLRDRCILSKGHAAIALYAVLRSVGVITAALNDYGDIASPLEGHPDMTALPGVDFSTGSLGQGLSAGLGMAIALAGTGAQVWVILGDGECQEGQIWEAAMLAARMRVRNLHVVIDANRYQEWGWEDVPGVRGLPVPDLAERWCAFGWHVSEVDGHDFDALREAFHRAGDAAHGPTAIVAHTVKGKGYPLLEADPIRFHCATVDEREHLHLLEARP
jgi:transketolase